jgi:hypothetical protein
MAKKVATDGLHSAIPVPSSPYATGGGGTKFEHRVGALCLARLLSGTVVSELGERTPTRVAFQQAATSAVDDIVLLADAENGARSIRLAIACRRRPKFVRSNGKTKELVVSLVRADLAADSSSEIEDRIAIAVSGHQGGAKEVAELAGLARNQYDAAAYFSLINDSGQYSANLRSRLSHLTDLVGSALATIKFPNAGSTEHRCWSLLRRLYVLGPHFEHSNEEDWAALADDLKPWSVGNTTASAITLRNELEILVGEFAQTAAAVDANVLRRRLHAFINPTAHRSSDGWTRLLLLDREARAVVPRTLTGSGKKGQLTLERTEVRTKLAAALQQAGGHLVVRGESGVGKSAAVLDAVEASVLDADCQALAINLRHLPDSPLELVAALSAPLESLLAELTAPRRLLIVDAAEAAAENKREVFTHILRSARSSDVIVVAVAASEGAGVAVELMKAGGAEVQEYVVPSLSEDEISVTVGHFEELRRLADDPKGRDLLRRPMVIELLARAGDPGVPLSESDALEHVWKQLVRNGERLDAGLPDAREQTMLSLAAHAFTKGSSDSLLASLDATAVAGLRHSALLRPRGELPWERVPEFAHDILRAYAVARYLLATRDPASELHGVSAPRWALPAARLACELLLSSADTARDPLRGRFERLQATFDDLAASGHGERWADVPTEALLAIAHPLPILQDAWSALLEKDATGAHRLIRVLRLRHQREWVLDTIVAEPVITQLLDEATPSGLDEEAANLVRDWLRAHVLRRTPGGQPTRLALAQAIVHRCAENERELDGREAEALAARAARSPEEIVADEERRRQFAALASVSVGPRRRARPRARRRPFEWIRESSIAHLALLGPDLGPKGEAILRRIIEDEPHSLAPAVETPLAGQALADFDPTLLIDLVGAYYLDADVEDEDGLGYAGLHDDGIRDHMGEGFGTPLAAYYRGPFLAMFRTDYRRGAACLNRLLNHAARHRVRILSNLRSGPAGDEDDGQYEHELSITGEPRTYVGDGHVWLWYRGTGVGPYPCMSALQALELVSDEIIRLGVPVARLVPLLLEGAESLAMPGLVLGLLVRHLETAGDALDPFLVEPLIWELEFSRSVQDRVSGLAAQVPGLEGLDRRSWSLREACMMLMVRAEGGRIEQLRRLGERLLTAARVQIADDTSPGARQHLAAVQNWAAGLDRAAYEVKEQDGQLRIQQVTAPEVEAILGETNADLGRGNEAVGLTVRHAFTRDHGGRVPDMSREVLAADLATAQNLLADPPHSALGASPDGPVAVAASAIEMHFDRGVDVTNADLQWSASVLLDVASAIDDRPNDAFDDSLVSQGPDRSAGRGLPYLLLPSARGLRRALRIDSSDGVEHLIVLSRAVAWGASHEARLAYSRGLDAVWLTPCAADLQGRCHHRVAFDLIEASYRDCVLGPWSNDLRQITIGQLDPPLTASLSAIDADHIDVRRLSAALRAYGSAAISGACCREEAQAALGVLLAAHRRSMLAREHGYHHSDSDSLIAARAALWQASDGRDRPLLEHIEAYLGDSRMLAEALKAVNAAAEERAHAAAQARQLWPRLMDRVLDATVGKSDGFTDRYWDDSVLAALVPNSAYAWGYLTLELAGKPEKWRDLLAWTSQVERWLGVAVRNRKCIDALVMAVRELEVADQIDTGLKWIEQILEGGGEECANTFTLPEWLHERRVDLTTPEQEARWQRAVDLLVVSGDHRVADLAD